MSRRRRPHYPLKTIRAAFSDAARLNRTKGAASGAENLGMDDHLTSRDFDKSMPSDINPAIWQDVYKPIIGRQEVYVKFTLDTHGELLLITSRKTSHDQSTRLSGRN
jgi:hypothetical protein